MDLSWNAWNWRRAHAEAWGLPGREIILLRLRRATNLGLGYRDYTSTILDRGVRLLGLILVLRGPLLQFEDTIARKLESLRDCSVTVLGPRIGMPLAARVHGIGGRVVSVSEIAERESLVQVIRQLTAQTGHPSATFMIGTMEAERQAAERAGLGLFVDAWRYFDLSV